MPDLVAGLSEQQIAGLMSLPEDALLANIALARGRGAVGRDAIAQGLEMYRNLRTVLQTSICTNEGVMKAHRIASTGTAPVVLAALVDCVSGYLTGISAASFCVLVMREGLASYCEAGWSAAG